MLLADPGPGVHVHEAVVTQVGDEALSLNQGHFHLRDNNNNDDDDDNNNNKKTKKKKKKKKK